MQYIIKQLRERISPVLKGSYRYYKNLMLKPVYLKRWKMQGCPIPPPHIVKQKIIREYAPKFKCRILVETGTYLGDMVAAQRKYFDKIYSIELGTELWENAKRRFDKYSNIKILQGDSGKVLGEVVTQLNQPTIFWLDGHYSGGNTARGDLECPIYNELRAIFNSKINNHIILIDDARLFNGYNDYPNFIDLEKYIKKFSKNAVIIIENDIIRVTFENSNRNY